MLQVTGRVTDKITGGPISGVTVRLSITGLGSPAGPIASASTNSSGLYSLTSTSFPSGSAVWHYWLSFSRTGYYDQILEAQSTGGTVNAQLTPTSSTRPPVTPYVPPVPYVPPTPVEQLCQLQVHFIRLPGASEARAQAILGTMTTIANGCITYPPPYGYVGGYAAVTSGLNWTGNYFWFRYKKLGTPAIPLGIIALAFFTVLFIASLVYSGWIEWLTYKEGQLALQEKVVNTKAELIAIITELYGAGKLTAEQYLAFLKAINASMDIPVIPGANGAAWTWPSIANLMPLIYVIALVGAIAIAYAYLR